MTDDNCGWPTADGTACEHPPTEDNGRCWIHADDERRVGRPSTFTDELGREAVAAASKPISQTGVARAIGVPESTLRSWLDQSPDFEAADGERRDFSRAFRRARAEPEELLTRAPLTRPEEVDGQHARFLLSTSFDYVKTERTEHTGADGGPIRTEATDEERDRLNDALDGEPET